MLGFGLGLTHFGTRGGVSDTPDSSVSGAALMLASEPEGFAIDFSDASICIKDLTTPANSFASQGTVLNGALVGPGAKITYASPSPKLCKKSDGTYGYRAQNLYLNSESPANQSVTVVSGLPYIIAVTGTVSITLSGAAIGTVTAGNPITFTASTGTLTCGSTSGAGTVHLRSTLAASEYIRTTTVPLYDLPYDWTGTYYYPLVEPAATNLFLNSRAAATQNFSVTAQAYTLSFIGTGTITLSGTSTAGPLVGTGANNRVSLTFTPSAGTLTLTVSGTMDLVQLETGTVATSPIITGSATVTRAADNLSMLTSAFPFNAAAVTTFVEADTYAASHSEHRTFLQLNDGSANNKFSQLANAITNLKAFFVGSGGGTSAFIVGDAITAGTPHKFASSAAANDFRSSIDGVLGTPDTSGSMPSGITTLRLGADFTANRETRGHIRKVMVLPRTMTNAELQALTA